MVRKRNVPYYPSRDELGEVLKTCPALPVFYLVMFIESRRPSEERELPDFSDPRKYTGVRPQRQESFQTGIVSLDKHSRFSRRIPYS